MDEGVIGRPRKVTGAIPAATAAQDKHSTAQYSTVHAAAAAHPDPAARSSPQAVFVQIQKAER
ncbi:hypothetical protein V491_03103, partial [Pseudogymnoascus sp. VKM F-3775]